MNEHFLRIYHQLRYWGLVANQYDFSKFWLGQCASYYSSIKARRIEPNSNAMLALLARLRSYNENLKSNDILRTDIQLQQLSRMLEQEADVIAELLFESSLQRVAKRHSMHEGMSV